MFKWSCEFYLINTYVYDLDSALKRFKDAGEMLIKNSGNGASECSGTYKQGVADNGLYLY